MITNKKILITGGKGFFGSHIVNLLNEKNIVYNPSSKDFDLTKENDVIKMFEKYHDIDIIIHAAANIGGIGYSSTHSAVQFYNNSLMNNYIVNYAWKNNIKKFVGIGSVCEYPENTKIPFKESSLWEGYPVETNDAYGLTKRMLLAQQIAYKKQYGFNSIHLLPINMYGPKDNFDINNSHVIPALIRKIIYAKNNKISYVEVWGTGEESREFLYVKDAARAVVLATEFYEDIEPINVGVGTEVKIKEIAEILKEIIGYKGKFNYLNNGLGGQKRRMLDVTKAREKFNFTANTNLESGLRKTVEYYINNFDVL